MSAVAEALADIETRAGGPKQAAAMLGVGYNGTYCRWKRDPGTIPDQGRFSIEVHAALKPADFKRLLVDRGIE